MVVVPLEKRKQRKLPESSSMTSKQVILSHIVEDWINIEDIQNEQLLQTAYENTTIRMNIFPRPLSMATYSNPYRYTANCAPIVKVNQMGENGIVHVISKVLTPVTKSIEELINSRSDMTTLRSILEKTDLMDYIRNEKTITLFAPTDEAFNKLEPNIRKSLKDGNGCALSKYLYGKF